MGYYDSEGNFFDGAPDGEVAGANNVQIIPVDGSPTSGIGAAGGALKDQIAMRVPNGAFSSPPPLADTPLDNDVNALPYWSAFTPIPTAGGGTGYPSGSHDASLVPHGTIVWTRSLPVVFGGINPGWLFFTSSQIATVSNLAIEQLIPYAIAPPSSNTVVTVSCFPQTSEADTFMTLTIKSLILGTVIATDTHALNDATWDGTLRCNLGYGEAPGGFIVRVEMNRSAGGAVASQCYIENVGIVTDSSEVFSGAVSTDTATGDLVDVDVFGHTVYRWNGASDTNIHGFAGGVDGRLIVVENIRASAQWLTLKYESATETTAANRIRTPRQMDFGLQPLSSALLIYDGATSRWRVLFGTQVDANFPNALVSDTTTGDLTGLSIPSGLYRWSGTAVAKIHGISSGRGLMKVIFNGTGSGVPLVLMHQSTTEATTANRIICPPGQSQNLMIWPGCAAVVVYDDTSNRWRVTAGQQIPGWLPFSYAIGNNHTSVQTTTINLAQINSGNAGAIAIPFVLDAPMRLQGITIRNIDTANLRTAEWAIYGDPQTIDNNLVQLIVGSAFSFTPVAASDRSANISGVPERLYPGQYWLVIRNTSTTQTFGLGLVGAGTMNTPNLCRTNTTVAALGATLDISAWTAQTYQALARLNGRIGAETAAF